MTYPIIPQQIPQSRRAEINQKILFSIDRGDGLVPKATIFNCYTGVGGLHSFKQADFANYYAYAEAKKAFEMGQFFTPHDVCHRMVNLLAPGPSDTVLDQCCGMGNFFNCLPNPYNAYGFDIDTDAVKVATHLYPEAHIEVCDIRCYHPSQRFDMLIGNPPFNLDFEGTPSQLYYLHKAWQALKPAGLLLLIVPASFPGSEFWDKTHVAAVNRDFSFIGQTALPAGTFSQVGVAHFETKIMAFMRASRHIAMQPYSDSESDCLTEEALKARIEAAKQTREALKYKTLREMQEISGEEERAYEYRLKKYLYELKTHKHLAGHYDKALALVSKLRDQVPPPACSYEEYREWEKRKLTYPQVLSVLYRYIRNQNETPRKEIALVRTSYGYKLKGYAPQMLSGLERRYTSLCDLVVHGASLPMPQEMTPRLEAQYALAAQTISRKQKEYLLQSQPFEEMEREAVIDGYIDRLTFVNRDMETCRFSSLQKHDMGLIFRKRYALLNWQQGSGKTAVAWHYGKYLLGRKTVKNVVILAPAIAVNLTWEDFLKRNGERFVRVKSRRDVEDAPEGIFLVVSLSMTGKLQKALSRFMKRRSQKICLVFDESDEISKPASCRTNLSLSIFRRAACKILATGTTTRNNIAELYSQTELLYNNSMNMICHCRNTYSEGKDGNMEEKENGYYGRPFPARGGARLFKACFSPGKSTVFGIEKQHQDVYNKEELRRLTGKTIITRKFKEFAGEKYRVHTHTIAPGRGERSVYQKVIEDFCELCKLYFHATGDSRKEAALRLVRQIQLLVKACSVPHTMPGYSGGFYPRKTQYIERLIQQIPDRLAVGCTTLEALEMYERYLARVFPERPLFIIRGDVAFKKRQTLLRRFEATDDGILLCTQQSLKSSANIPSCNQVILESLQWNIPRMEQFYFRFIRLDCQGQTDVHFITYGDSIEQNLLALVLTKERLNEFIKTGEVKEESAIFDEFNISPSLIESLLTREQDDKGRFRISWGKQQIR